MAHNETPPTEGSADVYPQYPSPPNQPNPDYPGSPNPYAPNPQYPGSPNPYGPNPQYPSSNPQYAPNSPNPSYPGTSNPQYTPPGAYPPNYAPTPSQAPTPAGGYGAAPSGAYGAPPTNPIGGGYPPSGSYPPPTPPQRRSSPLPILFSILGAVLIVALVGVGAVFALRGGPTTPVNPTATTALATATTAPTATATPNVAATYTENIPSCDNPNNWSVTSSQVKCGASAMTLTNAANAHTLAEASFNGTGSGFSASYDVSVNMSNITNACAGMIVLGDNNQGVGVYLCNDGSWFVNQYSASGAPKTLGSGGSGSVSLGSSNILDITVTPSNIQVTAEASSLTTVPRNDSLKTTYIALAVENANAANAASADFDTFSYAAIN